MIYEKIKTRKLVDKGWSGDTKYYATTGNGDKYLLRITKPERADHFHLGYLYMEKSAKLGIPMCMPIEFGQCPEGVYAIHSWIDGEDAENGFI